MNTLCFIAYQELRSGTVYYYKSILGVLRILDMFQLEGVGGKASGDVGTGSRAFPDNGLDRRQLGKGAGMAPASLGRRENRMSL